jgi:signal transduction histidine kinase
MQQQTGQAGEFNRAGRAAAILGETAVAEAGLTNPGPASAGLSGLGVSGLGVEETLAAESERQRVEAVVETLSSLRGRGESVAEVAHDARNMVTALGLYCDLLEEPGVLTAPFHHYAGELRLVATASRRLVEKLLALDQRMRPLEDFRWPAGSYPDPAEAEPARTGTSGDERPEYGRHWDLMPPVPISNLVAELKANRNLLSALAGPSIPVTVEADGGARPVRLNGEDLTRILVNLVKNAAEAMPEGGRISIGLHEFHAGAQTLPWLMLTIEDTGPGIPKRALEKIFDSGYTTRGRGGFIHGGSGQGGWPASHRGLGLSITRSIVEAAGGHIHAANRAGPGARFEIELPAGSR